LLPWRHTHLSVSQSSALDWPLSSNGSPRPLPSLAGSQLQHGTAGREPCIPYSAYTLGVLFTLLQQWAPKIFPYPKITTHRPLSPPTRLPLLGVYNFILSPPMLANGKLLDLSSTFTFCTSWGVCKC
jgi:hypothetical protein